MILLISLSAYDVSYQKSKAINNDIISVLIELADLGVHFIEEGLPGGS